MPYEQIPTAENEKDIPVTQVISKQTSKKTTSKNITQIFDEISIENKQFNKDMEKKNTLKMEIGENYSESKNNASQYNHPTGFKRDSVQIISTRCKTS